MLPERLLLARRWLRKARRDLDSAKKLARDTEPYFDTAIYHCQQAAEKAIKGFLAFREVRFEKTHDIRWLIAQAATLEPAFDDLRDEADLLTPYSVAYRYPDEEMEPNSTEFRAALDASERVCQFVVAVQPELAPDKM